jgi:hypothetical protein
MGQAFDEAWGLIAGNFGTPEATEIARLLLAEAVLSMATKGSCDVVALRSGALHALAMDYRYRAQIQPAQALSRDMVGALIRSKLRRRDRPS